MNRLRQVLRIGAIVHILVGPLVMLAMFVTGPWVIGDGKVHEALRTLEGVDWRGWVLLPASVLPLASQLLSNPAVARFFTTLWLAAFLLAIADVAITTVRVRNALKRDFAQERLSKHVFYAVMRCVTFRRFRLPKPQVAVNQQV